MDYEPGKEDIKTTTTEPRKDGFVHFNGSNHKNITSWVKSIHSFRFFNLTKNKRIFENYLESPLPLGLEDRLLAIIEKDSQNTTKRTKLEKHDVTTIHEETLTTPAGVVETTLSSEQK